MNKYNFLWFDDDIDKFNKYCDVIKSGVVGSEEKADLELIVVDKDIVGSIEKKVEAGDSVVPDLVIMDHIFTKGTARQIPLQMKGSSLAHLLRGVWPRVPIVCVTAGLSTNTKSFDQDVLSEYTSVFNYVNLDQHIEELYVIARDYKKINVDISDLRDNIANLVGVPSSERETFLRALPDEFKNQEYSTTEHRISNWIQNVLMKRPGFLYNKIRVATYLGLSEDGFDKVAPKFEAAKYIGPFATGKNPLWWVSEVQCILFEISNNKTSSISQVVGRELSGVNEQDFSKCYVGELEGDIPDVVARLQSSRTEEYAVCSRHTINDPTDVSVLPGFESLKIVFNKR